MHPTNENLESIIDMGNQQKFTTDHLHQQSTSITNENQSLLHLHYKKTIIKNMISLMMIHIHDKRI